MAKISAGSYDLNKWLYGGYETDIITVLYGDSATGKTNFCLLAAVSQAKKGNKVIFVDSEGGFSVERVKQMAGEESDKVLKNILLLKPTTFNEQKKAFEEILKHVSKDKISLIVVDGMTILYRLEFSAARGVDENEMKKINTELVRQMNILAQISRKQEIPVIVSNQVYRWEDANRMVGGDIMRYWGKCLIELVNENGKRTAFLRKHRSLPEKSFEFRIDDEGIKRKGWI